MSKKDYEKQRLYMILFIVSLGYKDNKYIEFNIKESKQTIDTKEFDKNKILKNNNRDKYEILKSIYESEINIPIETIFKPQGEQEGYNIYGIIKKNTLEYKLLELIIENSKYITNKIRENGKFDVVEEKQKDLKRYAAHETFVNKFKDEFKNENNNEIKVPMTYIAHAITAYNRFLMPEEDNSSTSSSCKWETVVKFTKKNIGEILPKYKDLIFEENDKLSYPEFLDKISILDVDVRNLISIQKYSSREDLNVFIKGVPGTGKSKKVKDLTRCMKRKNKLKINIHSDMSSSDIMQGISVNIDNKNNLIYKEKYGLILKHILSSILNPNEDFAIILEEIQEKELNKLIGSLIYLIDEDKRVSCKHIKNYINSKKIVNNDMNAVFDVIDGLLNENEDIDYVTIPNLIEDNKLQRNLIIPDNLYFYITTNYRQNKLVIEDNILRRFFIIEMYPEYKDTAPYENEFVSDFLQNLNKNIIRVFSDEAHPERMLIGHASWLKVNSHKELYTNFIKLCIDFNDVRLVEYREFKLLFEKEQWLDFIKECENKCDEVYKKIINILEKIYDEEVNSYFELIDSLQKENMKVE